MIDRFAPNRIKEAKGRRPTPKPSFPGSSMAMTSQSSNTQSTASPFMPANGAPAAAQFNFATPATAPSFPGANMTTQSSSDGPPVNHFGFANGAPASVQFNFATPANAPKAPLFPTPSMSTTAPSSNTPAAANPFMPAKETPAPEPFNFNVPTSAPLFPSQSVSTTAQPSSTPAAAPSILPAKDTPAPSPFNFATPVTAHPFPNPNLSTTQPSTNAAPTNPFSLTNGASEGNPVSRPNPFASLKMPASPLNESGPFSRNAGPPTTDNIFAPKAVGIFTNHVASPPKAITSPNRVASPPKAIASPNRVASPPKTLASPPEDIAPSKDISSHTEEIAPPRDVGSSSKATAPPLRDAVSPPKAIVPPPKDATSPTKAPASPSKGSGPAPNPFASMKMPNASDPFGSAGVHQSPLPQGKIAPTIGAMPSFKATPQAKAAPPPLPEPPQLPANGPLDFDFNALDMPPTEPPAHLSDTQKRQFVTIYRWNSLQASFKAAVADAPITDSMAPLCQLYLTRLQEIIDAEGLPKADLTGQKRKAIDEGREGPAQKRRMPETGLGTKKRKAADDGRDEDDGSSKTPSAFSGMSTARSSNKPKMIEDSRPVSSVQLGNHSVFPPKRNLEGNHPTSPTKSPKKRQMNADNPGTSPAKSPKKRDDQSFTNSAQKSATSSVFANILQKVENEKKVDSEKVVGKGDTATPTGDMATPTGDTATPTGIFGHLSSAKPAASPANMFKRVENGTGAEDGNVATPAPSIFGNVSSAKPASSSNLFGHLSTPKPASSSNLFGHLSTPKPGGEEPPAATPANIFGHLSGAKPGEEDGSSDENEDAQVDLTSVGPGEETEEVVTQIRAKAMTWDGQGQKWSNRGVGPCRVLRDQTTGRSRVLMRHDPRGSIIINTAIVGGPVYENPAPGTIKMAVVGEGGLSTYILKVKEPEVASAFVSVLKEASKAAT